MIKNRLQSIDGKSRYDCMIIGECFRISILTSHLVRLEYSSEGVFEDRPTQIIINRNFETPKYTVHESEEQLEIATKWLNIFYDKKKFSIGGLSIKVRSESRGIYSTWHYSEPISEGLWGTTRTLDQADGAIELEPGLQSRFGGFGIIDDSESLILLEDGWVQPREKEVEDIYFFGYGYEYSKCLKDFFHLCGKTPLLPRYALGNWWSRFYPYKDTEYIELMNRFEKEKIPLSIAVIDMDWHVKDIEAKYGKGWTGYTWNGELFTDPEKFLNDLHEKNLKVTMNLHPAEGVQPHEEMYEEMAKSLDIDPTSERPINFDFCDKGFIDAYFTYLHHPHEDIGVDFWWIDWQQGKTSKIEGVDPIWMLNHFHYMDNLKKNKRAMILSRYAGPGSHRYPIGFSGDSVISWASLDFQPYFTATAANIGYGWWSHDIGGHAAGIKDDELYVRWVQFGVFSPIMRLHSTFNKFNGKEPWKYPEPTHSIVADFLRLRHKLIPYIYTMNWNCHKNDEMLIKPMYYSYPEIEEAYNVPNQYTFGSEMIVCPITKKMDSAAQMGYTKVWLPEGTFIDIFTGFVYNGNRLVNMYRSIKSIPVLAKAGAIIPMSGGTDILRNGTDLPDELNVQIFAGADGEFEMYEDDGESFLYTQGDYAITSFEFLWRHDNDSIFTVHTNHNGIVELLEKRRYLLMFNGVTDKDEIIIMVNGNEVTFNKTYDKDKGILSLELPECNIKYEINVYFIGGLEIKKNDRTKEIYERLNNAYIEYELKEKIYNCIINNEDFCRAICQIQALNPPKDIMGEVLEILSVD